MKQRALLFAIAVASLAAIAFLLWPEDLARHEAPLVADQPVVADASQGVAALEDTSRRPFRESALPHASEALIPSTDGAPAIPVANLDVRIVSQQTGWPVEDAFLWITGFQPRADFVFDVLDRTKGTWDARPVSDAEGRISLRLTPALKLQLHVMGWDKSAPAIVEVEPLLSGEKRELVIEVETGDNKRFFGRLVADESDAPITVGTAGLYEHILAQREKRSSNKLLGPDPDMAPQKIVSVDGEGVFELAYASWDKPLVEIQAKGRSYLVRDLPEGHATRESAFEFRLIRSALVDARVIDRAGEPLAGMEVRVTTEGIDVLHIPLAEYEGLTARAWQKTTGEDGEAREIELPASVPLLVELVQKGQLLRREPEKLVLAPGERRALDLVLGGGTTLLGRMVDERGSAVADHEVWLARRSPGDPGRFFEQDEVDERTQTDAQGAFIFADVSPGQWRVGPAPPYINPYWVNPLEGTIAPTAMTITVERGAAEHALLLRVQRSLGIHGKVLDPEGQPVLARVEASSPDGSFSVLSTNEGVFALGPLVPGEYEVRAYEVKGSSKYAPSDLARVAAGEKPIELRLTEGGAIRGRVVDREGKGVSANIFFAREGDPPAALLTAQTSTNGWFQLPSLLPGTYAVVASTKEEGLTGLSEKLVVERGESLKVTVEVGPGAPLGVRCERPTDMRRVIVRRGGYVIANDVLRAGTTMDLLLPPGSVTVATVADAGGEKVEGRYELVAGLRTEAVLAALP